MSGKPMSDALKRFLQAELKSQTPEVPATLFTAQNNLANAEDEVACDWMGLGAFEDEDELGQDDFRAQIQDVTTELDALIEEKGGETSLSLLLI